MKIAELVAEIKLKGGKESTASMKGLLNSTMATKAALVAAVAALYKFSEVARREALALDMYQVNTGLSGEQLQKLGFKAAQAGVSMTELGSTIQRLQQMQTDFLLGKGNNSAFQLLGLDARKDPIAQLDEIGKKLRYLHSQNAALAKNMASQLGISDGMYYAIITNSTEELGQQFVITQKEQKTLVKLNAEWSKFWFYVKQIGIKLVAITAGLQTRFVRVISHILERVTLIFKRIGEMIERSKAFKNTLIAIGIAVAAVLAYFHPWLALLSLIGLILDDVFGYFNGEDSVTGAIINWVKNSKEAQDYLAGIKTLFDLIVGLGKILGIAFSPFIEQLKFMWDITKKIKDEVVGFIDTPAGKKILDIASQAAKTALNPLGTALEGVGAARRTYEEDIKPKIQNWTGSVYVTQNNNVQVEAGQNPEQAGRDFQRGMNDQAANEAAYQLQTT